MRPSVVESDAAAASSDCRVASSSFEGVFASGAPTADVVAVEPAMVEEEGPDAAQADRHVPAAANATTLQTA